VSLARKIATFAVVLLMASSSSATSCEVACAKLTGQTGHHSTATPKQNDRTHTSGTLEHHHQASAQDVAALPSPVSDVRFQPGDCAGVGAQPVQSAVSKPERQDLRVEISAAEEVTGISPLGSLSAAPLTHLSRPRSHVTIASSNLRI
jgi:hypothetical protein